MSRDRERQLLEHHDRQALRMLDGQPGPDCGCGHEGRNHGPLLHAGVRVQVAAGGDGGGGALVSEIRGPGLYCGIPSADYHADRLAAVPTLNQSLAWVLLTRSPAHAHEQHPQLGGDHADAPTDDMARGWFIHHLLLGGGAEIVALDYSDWRKQAAQDDRAKVIAEGKMPVLTRKLVEYQAVADELRCALGVFDECDKEVTALWTQPETGVLCRGRLDGLNVGAAIIADLKVCSDAGRSSADSSICRMGYHLQAAAYVEAAEVLRPELAGRVTFEWRFAEPQPPYAVAEVECGKEMLELGRSQWRRAGDTWARCLRDDRWPAYARREARPTPWAVSEDFERQLAAVGNNNEELGL